MKSKLQALRQMQRKLVKEMDKGFDGEVINNYLSVKEKIEMIERRERNECK